MRASRPASTSWSRLRRRRFLLSQVHILVVRHYFPVACGVRRGRAVARTGRGHRTAPRFASVVPMYAITIDQPGGPEVMTWAEQPDPELPPGHVLLDVAATAVNRADLLQRQGFYPPPPGA